MKTLQDKNCTNISFVNDKSLKVVTFESLSTVSYSPSMVTMAVSLVILEIFSVKEWPDLESWFGVVQGH